MKTITVFKTYDNVLHTSFRDAARHLDKIYGDKISKIGHGLVNCNGKYVALQDYVDANLALFLELEKIKADMVLVKDEEENDE